MLPDFTIIQRHIPHNRDIKVYPIADVHLGAREHMADAWKEFRTMVLEDPDAYLILAGDLLNNSTRNSVSNIFEETMRPREQKRLMTEMLMPLRDKILCAIPGNHEGRSGKDADDDPIYDICAKLDIEDLYRENLAFLKIRMGDLKGDGERNPTYMFVVSHGAGGGQLTGASVNRSERFGYAIDGADVLVVGHSHKPFVSPPFKIKIDPYNNKVSTRPFRVVCASSWLEYGSYAARKMLLPSGYVSEVITLGGNRKEIKVTI